MKSLTLILSLLLIAPAFGVTVLTPAQFDAAIAAGATDIDASAVVWTVPLRLNASGTLASPIKIKGGTFRDVRGATTFQMEYAACRINGSFINWTTPTFEYCEGTGCGVFGNNVTLNQPIARYNGANGIGFNSGSNCVWIGGEDNNNNRGYQNSLGQIIVPTWAGQAGTLKLSDGSYALDDSNEGGAGKQYNTKNLTIDGPKIHDNGGPLWLDAYNSGYLIQNCEVFGSIGTTANWEGQGIACEINDGGTIRNNYSHDNSGSDIAVMESQNVIVDGNTVGSIEFRALSGRPRSFQNVTVQNNRIKTGVGFSVGSAAVVLKNNIFATAAALATGSSLGATGSTIGATTQPTTAQVTPAVGIKLIGTDSSGIVWTLVPETGKATYQAARNGVTDTNTNSIATATIIGGIFYQVTSHNGGDIYGWIGGTWKSTLALPVQPTTAPTTDQSAQLKADQLTIAQLQAQVTRLLNALNGITSQARAATQP